MPNMFKKLSHGAGNFFKKLDSGATKFFNKLPSDVSHIANQTSDVLQNVGGKIADGAQKVGNFLEKNSGLISDGVAAGLYATGFGAPLATAVLAAGNTAQQVGTRMKRGGQQAQTGLNKLAQITTQKSNVLSNQISNLGLSGLKQAREGVQQAQQQAQQAVNNVRMPLPTIHH